MRERKKNVRIDVVVVAAVFTEDKETDFMLTL